MYFWTKFHPFHAYIVKSQQGTICEERISWIFGNTGPVPSALRDVCVILDIGSWWQKVINVIEKYLVLDTLLSGSYYYCLCSRVYNDDTASIQIIAGRPAVTL
jgi:hypothetical protein